MSAVHELKALWSINKNNNLHKSVSADDKNAFISVITKLYLTKQDKTVKSTRMIPHLYETGVINQ